MKKVINSLLGIVLLFVFTACGGSGSSGISTIQTSKLIDSSVSGVSYVCTGFSGLTDDGDFNYSNSCGDITFKVGGVTLSSINALALNTDAKLYISELAGKSRTNSTDTVVINILRFLQSIDNDNNPSNGIFITQDVRDALALSTLDLSSSSVSEEQLQELLSGFGKILISRNRAVEHFELTLRTNENVTIDTIAPDAPKLTSTPIQSNQNFVALEVHGELGSDIYVNGSKLGSLTTSTKEVIKLSLAGDDGTKSFNITLKDAKENESIALMFSITKDATIPTFTLTDVTVPENQITAFSVNATDVHPLSYELLGSDKDSFNISSLGVVTFKTAPNYEEIKERIFTVSVKVSDSFGNTITKSLIVNVSNIAEIVPTLRTFSVSINENTTVGTIIGKVNIIDNGDSSIIGFTLNNTSHFSISNLGEIMTKTVLDYEMTENYVLGVTATNSAGISSAINININIKNVTEANVSLYALNSKNSIWNYDTNGSTNSVVLSVDGTKAYLADGNEGLKIIDISNPFSPLLLGSYNTNKSATDVTLSVDETKAYVIINAENLLIIDVSNSSSPVLLSSYDTLNYPDSVMLSEDGTKAYVTDNASLVIIDVNNSTNPTLLGSYVTSQYADSVTLSTDGTKAYVVDSKNLLILDVNNSTNPTLLGSYATTNYARSVILSVDGRKAYVSDGKELVIIDVSNSATPTLLGRYGTNAIIKEIILSFDGTKAIVANGLGIEVIDVSIPTSPTLISSYDTNGYAYNLTLSPDGNKVFVADGSFGLQVIDINMPSSSALLAVYEINDHSNNLVLSSDKTKAFVVSNNSGLQIIDVNSPVSLSLLGSYNTGSYAKDVTLSLDGTKAFIAHGSSGLQIIDVSNPTSPSLLGNYDTSDYADSVVLSVDGTKVFVADGDSGLQIIDVSNLVSPSLLSTYNTSGYAVDVVLSSDGTKVFVADGDSGLQIIDVSNPVSPILSR